MSDMRKVICLAIALLLCVSLGMPAFAAENDFVPSITYKDGPDVDSAFMGDEDVSDCVVVTTIKEAKEKATDIQQKERDELLDVYEQLTDGEMDLPLDGDYVIRELVDVSFEYDDCRCEESHGAKDERLKQNGVTLTVDFDLNIGTSENLKVLVYVDGEWRLVDAVTINADGTVTVVFEDICPVAFCVERRSGSSIPQTGDMLGRSLILWVGLMAASAAAMVAMIVSRRKFVR
jgi:hypothetical protein